MELKVRTISLVDGEPSCFFSHKPETQFINDGFKAFIDPVKKKLVSAHEVTGSKNHGKSVCWDDNGNVQKLSLFIKGEEAYSYKVNDGDKREGKILTRGTITIAWDENLANERIRPVPDRSGVMTISSKEDILKPAIKSIVEHLIKESEDLRQRADKVLKFEYYLRS